MKSAGVLLLIGAIALSAPVANAHLCFVEKVERTSEGAQVYFVGDALHAPIAVDRKDGSEAWYIRHGSGAISEVDNNAPPEAALLLGYGDKATIFDTPHSACVLEILKGKDRDGLKIVDEGAIHTPPGGGSAVHRKEEFLAFP